MRDFVDRWARNRFLLVVMLMGSYSVQSLLITASKKRVTYSADVAVLLAELVKLVFAAAMLPPEVRASMSLSGRWLYAIPAVLYTLQNRLVFEALQKISPPEYQLLNNIKLFTTSLVFRVVMRRQLRVLQWLALLLLVLGMALATAPCGEAGQAQAQDARTGVLIMLAVSWCSAVAGVLNEWLIKKSQNVLEANIWLYGFGVAAAIFQLLVVDGAGVRDPLAGFTSSLLPWSVVLCNAILGQSIAFLFRYADSIVKLYAVSAAMAFTAFFSAIFLDFSMGFHSAAGYFVSFLSMCLYYTPSQVLLSTDVEFIEQLTSRTENEKEKAK
ncbi:CSTLP1 [Symbiodinium sp. CCMP2456]|nr:CSTLP1 [Symbiodinium sp. CCMP2456]